MVQRHCLSRQAMGMINLTADMPVIFFRVQVKQGCQNEYATVYKHRQKFSDILIHL